MSVPSINTLPEVGLSTPPSICSNVDFPLPEGPIIATNSPFCTLKDTLSNAFTFISPFPYVFVKFSTFNISIIFFLFSLFYVFIIFRKSDK